MPNRHKRVLSASSIVGSENGMPSLTAMSVRSHVQGSPDVLAADDDDMGEDELIVDDDHDSDEDYVPEGDFFEEGIQDVPGDDIPLDLPTQSQDDDQDIEAAASLTGKEKSVPTRLKTRDQLFNLKGIEMPVLEARSAKKSPYLFHDLQDKSKELPGWKDGVYRWDRGDKVDIPDYMPQFLIYRNHPGMCDPSGVAYVYEGCPELLLYYYRYFQNLTIPQSVHKPDLDKLGLLELEPHMYIFYRNVRESRDPKHDLLKMWVSDEKEVRTTCESETQEALLYRDKLLGDKATLKGGKKRGTHLEQSGRGHGNGQGDRCLTFMQSIESQRGIGHPPGNMSQAYMKGDDTLLDLKEFEKNVFGIATTMLRQYAPEDWIEDQVKRFLINNLPAIGVDDNHGFFSQQQINLAGVEKAESSEGLDKNMGKAGLPHYDPKDCPQGYTCMFATSNFDCFAEDDIHPGFFHFLEVGLYVKCSNFRLVYFSGLHFHGGSPPRARKGFEFPEWCTRFNNILYPNDFLLSGFLAMVLTVSAGLSRIEVFPAVRYDPKGPATIDEGPLNFMRDGDSIMSRQAYINYVCRQIVILLESMLKQSPHLRLNLEAVKMLFIDKATEQVVDVWKTWQYPPEQMPMKSEDMASHSVHMEHKKVDACLSVPTQLRRLYNSSKLRMTKEPGQSGRGKLQINQDALLKAKKKQKVRHPVQDDSPAFAHGEELPALRRSNRKHSSKSTAELSEEEDADEGNTRVVKSPNGLPSILDKRLKILQFPPFSTKQLDLLGGLSKEPEPHVQSKVALSAMLTHWCNSDVRDIKRFIQTTQQWTTVEHGSQVGDALDLCACVLRAQVMFGHWIWWTFLRQDLPSLVRGYLEGVTSSHWVNQVIAYIHKQYDMAKSSLPVVVAFRDVFPNFYHAFHGLYLDAFLGQIGIILEEQRYTCLVTHTCEVIAQWVALPHSQRDRNRNTGSFGDWDTRGFFVDSILRLQHPGLLLVSDLNKVYNHARLPVLSDQDGDWIEESLAKAFLTDDEEVNLRLEGLDSIAFQFLPNEFDGHLLPHPVESVSIIPVLPLSEAPPINSQSILTEEDVQAAMNVPSSIKDAGDAIVKFLIDIERLHGPSWNSFVSRWPDTWKRSLPAPNMSQNDMIAHWVAWNRDHHCPFRENAPSRFTYKREFGDRSYLTPSAFFSEAVFRGVTFHTDYVRDAFAPRSDTDTSPRREMELRDLNHWKQVVQDVTTHLKNLPNPKSDLEITRYFCNMSAYGGAPNAQQNIKNADLYWLAAVQWGKTFARQTIPIPYQKYKDFMDSETNLGHLYNIGGLQKMLILGDLYLAGVVEPPSDEEFFGMMLKTGAGASDALQLLGVLDKVSVVNAARKKRGQPALTGADPSRVETAKKLYAYVLSSLHRLGKSHLLPDKFHYEHLLCKVKRVISMGPLQYQVFAHFFRNLPKGDPRLKLKKK